MKKLVALVVALAMVLCVGTALAVAQIPATIDKVPNLPNEPAMPEYTLEVVEDHYELKVDKDNISGVSLQGESSDGSQYLWFNWNEEKKAYISQEVLMDEYKDDAYLNIAQRVQDTEGYYEYSSVTCNPFTKELRFSTAEIGKQNGDKWSFDYYNWFYDDNEFNYTSNNDETSVDVNYSLDDNSVIRYSVYNFAEDMRVYYDKFGRIHWVEASIGDDWCEWDPDSNVWTSWDADGNQIVVNAEPFDESKYPAPYAAEFVPTKLPDKFSDIGNSEDVKKAVIALDKVTVADSTLSLADSMDYDDVFVRKEYVDEKGKTQKEYEYLSFNEATGTWELSKDFLSNADSYKITVKKGDMRSTYDQNGNLVSTQTMIDNRYSVTYYTDGKYTVYDTRSDSASEANYDADGKMVSYSYYNLDMSKYVEYATDGTLLKALVDSKDGKTYIYDAEAGWSVSVQDTETGKWVETPIDASELPEDVNTEDMEPLFIIAKKPKYTWYPNNTVGVAGISLRDTYPELTKKWYNVVPVDLTQDGRQTFTLVASNLFYIGNAYVDVKGDDITVGYALAKGHGYVKGECLQWFTSVDEITSDFLNNPEGKVAFGQTISRANDLKGQDVALLFICNTVTYRQPYTNSDVPLTRYWPNLDEWKAYREDLTALMEKLPEQAE